MPILTKIFTAFFGKKSDKDIKFLSPIVKEINDQFLELEKLSDDEIKSRYQSIKSDFRSTVNSKRKELADSNV